MKLLNNEEMYAVDGGGKSFLWYIVAGAVSFLVGFFGGLVNPRACNR